MSTDFFQVGRLHVLVYCCRLTGWPVIHQWFHDPTTQEVSAAITKAFADLGVPTRIRSDGGPQFDAHVFREMLKKWAVAWGPSSPHYLQSNGHAEAAVKAAKELVLKEAASGDLVTDHFRQALLELRNTPRAGDKSPAEMLFGAPLRSIIPAHRSLFSPQWKSITEGRERQTEIDARIKSHYDTTARELKELHIGTAVRIQDPSTKRWPHVGTIVGIGRAGGRPRSYRVRFASGRHLWRNRRHLRPMRAASSAEGRRCETTAPDQTAATMPTEDPPTQFNGAADRPRRSEKSKRIPVKYVDFDMSRNSTFMYPRAKRVR